MPRVSHPSHPERPAYGAEPAGVSDPSGSWRAPAFPAPLVLVKQKDASGADPAALPEVAEVAPPTTDERLDRLIERVDHLGETLSEGVARTNVMLLAVLNDTAALKKRLKRSRTLLTVSPETSQPRRFARA